MIEGKEQGSSEAADRVLNSLRLCLIVPEMPDSAAQCQLPGLHQWKPLLPSDVHQEMSGNPWQTQRGLPQNLSECLAQFYCRASI